MKRFLPFIIAALAVTASASFAGEGGAQGKSPAQVCQNAHAAAANRANAAKACKAEIAIPEDDFRAAHEGKSFAEFYGRNKNDRNAYGKCVSSKASAATARQEAATMKAAKACKAERAADRAAFTAKYGGKAASAFGSVFPRRARSNRPARADRSGEGEAETSPRRLGVRVGSILTEGTALEHLELVDSDLRFRRPWYGAPHLELSAAKTTRRLGNAQQGLSRWAGSNAISRVGSRRWRQQAARSRPPHEGSTGEVLEGVSRHEVPRLAVENDV